MDRPVSYVDRLISPYVVRMNGLILDRYFPTSYSRCHCEWVTCPDVCDAGRDHHLWWPTAGRRRGSAARGRPPRRSTGRRSPAPRARPATSRTFGGGLLVEVIGPDADAPAVHDPLLTRRRATTPPHAHGDPRPNATPARAPARGAAPEPRWVMGPMRWLARGPEPSHYGLGAAGYTEDVPKLRVITRVGSTRAIIGLRRMTVPPAPAQLSELALEGER